LSAYPQVAPRRLVPVTPEPAVRSGARTERRTERALAVLASCLLLLIGWMIYYVFHRAWPSFSHNGVGWLGSGGDAGQQLNDIFNSPADPHHYVYHLRAWPLLYGTALTTAGAVALGLAFATFASIFIVEFAPPRMRRWMQPVVRLLAAVPSVIYGLIALLVIVPFVGNHLISDGRKTSVDRVVQLSGESILVGILILTIMITPIMIAIITDALRTVPRSWTEGAHALGVNRWRVMWTIAVRAARPAIVAAAVLATARALGEAIMLSMVAGAQIFAPNPLDGVTFIFEPTQPLAATIVKNAEGLSVTPFGQTLYAFAAVLLVSAAFLSFGGWWIKQRMRRYGLAP
jgi:phosphate transport system permease protein